MIFEFIQISKSRKFSFMTGILVSVFGVFFELASIYLLGFLVDKRQREPYMFDNILQENRSIFVFFITLLIISIIFRTFINHPAISKTMKQQS